MLRSGVDERWPIPAENIMPAQHLWEAAWIVGSSGKERALSQLVYARSSVKA